MTNIRYILHFSSLLNPPSFFWEGLLEHILTTQSNWAIAIPKDLEVKRSEAIDKRLSEATIAANWDRLSEEQFETFSKPSVLISFTPLNPKDPFIHLSKQSNTIVVAPHHNDIFSKKSESILEQLESIDILLSGYQKDEIPLGSNIDALKSVFERALFLEPSIQSDPAPASKTQRYLIINDVSKNSGRLSDPWKGETDNDPSILLNILSNALPRSSSIELSNDHALSSTQTELIRKSEYVIVSTENPQLFEAIASTGLASHSRIIPCSLYCNSPYRLERIGIPMVFDFRDSLTSAKGALKRDLWKYICNLKSATRNYPLEQSAIRNHQETCNPISQLKKIESRILERYATSEAENSDKSLRQLECTWQSLINRSQANARYTYQLRVFPPIIYNRHLQNEKYRHLALSEHAARLLLQNFDREFPPDREWLEHFIACVDSYPNFLDICHDLLSVFPDQNHRYLYEGPHWASRLAYLYFRPFWLDFYSNNAERAISSNASLCYKIIQFDNKGERPHPKSDFWTLSWGIAGGFSSDTLDFARQRLDRGSKFATQITMFANIALKGSYRQKAQETLDLITPNTLDNLNEFKELLFAACAFAISNEPQKAERPLKRLHEIQPDLAHPDYELQLHHIAMIYASQGLTKEAKRLFLAGLKSKPDTEKYMSYLIDSCPQQPRIQIPSFNLPL